MYFMDIFWIIGLLVTGLASLGVNSAYKKYKKVKNNNNLTGYDVARKILDYNGLNDILILETSGELSDHYDPTRKVVKLSSDIYNGQSIASVAVAAHECGHAVQDKENYLFLRIRAAIVPVVNLASKLGYVVLIIGLLAGLTRLIYVGIIAEGAILVFQLITLPVEFNASNRALKFILELGLVDKKEKDEARSMLTAAAMTYVASVINALLQVLRLVLMFTNRRD